MRSAQRRAMRQRVRAVGGALLLLCGLVAAAAALFSASSSSSSGRQLSESLHVRVHLHHKAANSSNSFADVANASASTAEEESCGAMADWETHGGVALYVFLLLYVFVALAIVCDDYFVSSLEKITDALGLSQDVAGATFMAAGSSAPELFVSLADNVFTRPLGSLGVGTIVGSAIFNILIIIALSALLAGQVLQLDWRPLLRDSLWYAWSIVALTLVIWDGSVDAYEAGMLFGSYIAYCVYMSQNERVIAACCRRPEESLDEETVMDDPAVDEAAEKAARLVDGHVSSSDAKRAWTIDVERVEEAPVSSLKPVARSPGARPSETGTTAPHHAHPHRLGSQTKLNPMFRSKYRMFQYHPHLNDRSASGRALTLEGDELHPPLPQPIVRPVVAGSLRPLNVTTTAAAVELATKPKEEVVESDAELGGYFEELFAVPPGVFPKLWFLLTRPIVLAMRLTIPDCRYPQFFGPCGFTATFVLSIVWIALLSHFTVVWATKVGCLAGIPSALMGLTIIAAGTSVPDALSSVLVARDGQGDMAVSNAIGSNVFDILLGLGLPFFLSNVVYGEPVKVVTDDLEISIFILFGVLAAVLLLLATARWRLHPIAGAIMALMYAGYVVFSYLRGLGQI